MARPPKFPPTMQPHKGRARVRYRGQEFYLGPWGSPEAEREYQKLIVHLAKMENQPEKIPVNLADPTVGDLCCAYLDDLKKRSPADGRRVEEAIFAIKPLTRVWGDLPTKQFKRNHLQKLQEAMATGSWLTPEEKKYRQRRKMPIAWCQKQVNRQIVRVRAVFRWGEGTLAPEGIWNHLRSLPPMPDDHPLARHTEPTHVTTREELEKVKQHCPDAVATMLELQWLAGMRSGEVRIMRTRDLDRSGDVWLYRPGSHLPYGQHKNSWRRHKRVIPLGPEAQRILLPWLRDDQPDAYLFCPEQKRKLDHYSRVVYAQAVNRACKKAGVKIRPYGGRHAARDRIAAEAGAEAAKAQLGHKTLAVTESYGSLNMELAKEVMKKIG